jgi:iron-sulfur cluster repair protein YtfE (RIC family)
MDAISLLKNDHRMVESLFQKIEGVTPSRYPAIFAKIKNALDAHAHIEETIFYPRLKKDGKKDLADIVLEGIEEHGQIKKFLREIASLPKKSEELEPKVKVLIEDTRHHVKEEEGDMFPLVEDQFNAEAREKLGQRMQAAKEKFLTARGLTVPRQKQQEMETKGPIGKLMDSASELVKTVLSKPADDNKRASTNRTTAKTASASSAKRASGNGAKGKAANGRSANGNAGSSKSKQASAAKPGKSAGNNSRAKTALKPKSTSGTKTSSSRSRQTSTRA